MSGRASRERRGPSARGVSNFGAETARLSPDPRPIGVFDSGVGGLTVVRRLFELLPRESVSYFGDTARLPYGSKTRPTIIQFSMENTRWLVDHGVKAVVVACNTSTALALPELQKKFDLPVIGVIEPGARAAGRLTRSGRIGVIATRATTQSRAYSRALARISRKFAVTERACPLFVPLVEEGWLDHAATREVAREYLAPLVRRKVDTLVLGCTHYPLIREVIQEVMGPHVRLIDSGEIPYPVFVLAGLLPWGYFAAGVSGAANSLIGNSNLITKVYFPGLLIPAASVTAALIDLAVAAVVLGGMLIWHGIAPSRSNCRVSRTPRD